MHFQEKVSFLISFILKQIVYYIYLFSHALYGPFLLTEWTTVVLFNPQGHATVMERMIAFTPYYYTILFPIEIFLAFGLTTQTCICNNLEQIDFV